MIELNHRFITISVPDYGSKTDITLFDLLQSILLEGGDERRLLNLFLSNIL